MKAAIMWDAGGVTVFEAFSEPARRVLFWARYEADSLKSDWMEPEHILLGFIDEDQGDWKGRFAEALGLNASRPLNQESSETEEPFLSSETAQRLRAVSLIDDSQIETLQKNNKPVSLETGSLLHAAFQHANGSKVSSLHLLWALLTNADSPLAQKLIENGVTEKLVDDAIRERIK